MYPELVCHDFLLTPFASLPYTTLLRGWKNNRLGHTCVEKHETAESKADKIKWITVLFCLASIWRLWLSLLESIWSLPLHTISMSAASSFHPQAGTSLAHNSSKMFIARKDGHLSIEPRDVSFSLGTIRFRLRFEKGLPSEPTSTVRVQDE